MRRIRSRGHVDRASHNRNTQIYRHVPERSSGQPRSSRVASAFVLLNQSKNLVAICRRRNARRSERFRNCVRSGMVLSADAEVQWWTVPQYRVSEAAAVLGVSDDTVRRWMDSGQLPTERDAAGRLAVDGAALAAFARSQARST